MSVSKQLIHLRNVKGISQEELASLMNVTRQAVSKRETDQTLPDSEKIIRLSEIFGEIGRACRERVLRLV